MLTLHRREAAVTAALPATAPVPALLGGWARLRADPPPDLHPWAESRLDLLCALSTQALAAVDGPTVSHTDLRADNLLLRPDGRVVVVDWPHACVGAAWLDRVCLLLSVVVHGGLDVTRELATSGATPDQVRAVAAGLTGYFLDAARQPESPGIPTLRAFQRLQGDALLAWLCPIVGL